MEKIRVKGVSLYFQVENYIKDKITSNEWSMGFKLPSEPELAKQLNVSRATIRQAIADLVESGLLIRKHGVGTFVTDTMYEGDFITRYLPDDFGKMHSLISKKIVKAPYSLAEKLGVPLGTELYEIKRARYLREEKSVALLETSYLEAGRFPGLCEHEFSGNFKMYDLLDKYYQVKLLHATTSVEPTILKAEEADLLESEVGTPVLLITRICNDLYGKPTIVTKSLLSPYRCRIIVSNGLL